jgi:hypothetical protein
MEANPMKLTYRGVSYDYQPTQVETHAEAMDGKYRNAGLKFRTRAAKVPILSSTLDLFYRGFQYTVDGTQPAVAEAVTLKAPVNLIYRGFNYKIGDTQPARVFRPESIAEKARVLVMRHRQKADQREEAVLERFEEAIGLSENVWTTYDRHDAAAS